MKFLQLVALIAAALAFTANASAKEAAPKSSTVVFTNKLVDGKKTWLPATASIKSNTPTEIKVVNELDEAHGFAVEGLVEPTVIMPKETRSFKVTAKNKGAVKVSCHMHPAHVGAQLQVE